MKTMSVLSTLIVTLTLNVGAMAQRGTMEGVIDNPDQVSMDHEKMNSLSFNVPKFQGMLDEALKDDVKTAHMAFQMTLGGFLIMAEAWKDYIETGHHGAFSEALNRGSMIDEKDVFWDLASARKKVLDSLNLSDAEQSQNLDQLFKLLDDVFSKAIPEEKVMTDLVEAIGFASIVVSDIEELTSMGEEGDDEVELLHKAAQVMLKGIESYEKLSGLSFARG